MNIKEIDSKILFKEFEVQVPYKEVDSSINAKIAEIIPTVSLPGFRKGKAPLNIVKKKYENNVLSEVIEKLVEDKTKKLLEEKKLIKNKKFEIKIKKNIPQKSGMGGGSMNAAAIIKYFTKKKNR